ncbi:MAG: hypothetical protein ACRDH9_02575 [Actinomycetota bacterium]
MRAEFYRAAEPELTIGSAEWDGRRAIITPLGDEARAMLERVFRVSGVLVDDPSLGSSGTSGPIVVQPGDMEWFRAAALVRGAEIGLGVRLATDKPGGWDPALDPQSYGWAGKKPALPRER